MRRVTTLAALATLLACALPAAGHAATLIVKSTGPGSVTVDPQGTLGRCPTAGGWCHLHYPDGTAVTIVGTSPSSLATWGGACAGTLPACRLTLDAPKTVLARFGEPDRRDLGPIARPARIPITVVGDGALFVNGTLCTTRRCDVGFHPGHTVFVAPARGHLARWGGTCGGTGRCIFTAVRDRADRPPRVIAYFGR